MEIDYEKAFNKFKKMNWEHEYGEMGLMNRNDFERAVKSLIPEWISVTERKEIKGGWYLVVNPNSQPANEYELAFYRNYNGMFIRDSGDVIHPSYYIALSNLPKPPINHLE